MSASRRTVVVTGMGAVTPLGWTLPETFRRLCAGESGIREIPRLAAAGFPVAIGAVVPDLEALLDRHPDARAHGSRKLAYFEEALGEAKRQAGIDAFAPDRCGVFLGAETSRVPFDITFQLYRRAGNAAFGIDLPRALKHGRGLATFNQQISKSPHFLPVYIARRQGIRGPVLATSNACASTNFAIGEAFRRLRDGRLDLAVVGSADEMVDEYTLTAFSLLRALATGRGDPATASRPFDLTRSGFVLGEAGAALILETLDHALARGAKPLCELAGYGSTSDGEKITACNPRGEWLAAAITACLADAGLAPGEVQYVNAHATSTRLGDAAEIQAIKRAFGDHARRVKISSTKSMLGHCVAAAGAVEAVVTIQTLLDGVIHPTAHLTAPDPECDLDCCAGPAVRLEVTAALSNSCAFSGNNSCLAFRKWPPAASLRPDCDTI